jgi:hypothetical protein
MTPRIFVICMVFALGSWVAGCRCSAPPSATRPEPVAKLSPSASALPSAMPSEAPAPPPATPTLATPRGQLAATVVLADSPAEHYGDTDVRPSYILHHLRGANLITRGDSIYELKDDKLTEADSRWIGFHPFGQSLVGIDSLWVDVDALVGSWPSAVWASATGVWNSDGARIYTPFSDVYRRSSDGFFERLTGDDATHPLQNIVAWSRGRVVSYWDSAFHILSGDKKLVPKLAEGTSSNCPVRVEVEGIAALPTGDLYAIGRGPCDDNAYLVEHWSDDSADSKSVQPLPAALSAAVPADSPHSFGVSASPWILAATPNAIYVGRSRGEIGLPQSRLARFDGATWQLLPLPADEAISALDVASDGSLWLVLDDTPYVYSAGNWREVKLTPPPLPQELDAGAPTPRLKLTSVLALSHDRAYFGAHVSYRHSSNGPAYEAGLIFAVGAEPLSAAEPDTKQQAQSPESDAGPDAGSDAGSDAGAGGEFSPFSVGCTTPFVVLFAVSSRAPADFDYPATRDALLATTARPAVKFVEFSYRGHRTLGASAKSADDANALVRLIADRVKGSKPTLVCYAPASIIREVEFAL